METLFTVLRHIPMLLDNTFGLGKDRVAIALMSVMTMEITLIRIAQLNRMKRDASRYMPVHRLSLILLTETGIVLNILAILKNLNI